MMALGAMGPAQSWRGQEGLFQALQNGRQSPGQIVIEQHQAGIEIRHAHARALSRHGFEQQMGCRGRVQGHGRLQVGAQGADTDFKAGLSDQAGQCPQTFQVVRIARVALGNDQHPAGGWATAFDGLAHGLNTERMAVGGEVVEACREQIGIHRGELESGIAQINGGIEGRAGALPLAAEPVLDRALLSQQGSLQMPNAFLLHKRQTGEPDGIDDGHDEIPGRANQAPMILNRSYRWMSLNKGKRHEHHGRTRGRRDGQAICG